MRTVGILSDWKLGSRFGLQAVGRSQRAIAQINDSPVLHAEYHMCGHKEQAWDESGASLRCNLPLRLRLRKAENLCGAVCLSDCVLVTQKAGRHRGPACITRPGAYNAPYAQQ